MTQNPNIRIDVNPGRLDIGMTFHLFLGFGTNFNPLYAYRQILFCQKDNLIHKTYSTVCMYVHIFLRSHMTLFRLFVKGV